MSLYAQLLKLANDTDHQLEILLTEADNLEDDAYVEARGRIAALTEMRDKIRALLVIARLPESAHS